MMALSKGISLHRAKFAAGGETKSSSKQTKDQFSLSNRQLELLGTKKKNDQGVSEGAKSRPALKTSQSMEPLVPIHQTLTGLAHKSSIGGDKLNSRSPFSTPSKQMGSGSLYLVPSSSPVSSNLASSGQDKAVSSPWSGRRSSARDIATEEQLEQLLADIDENRMSICGEKKRAHAEQKWQVKPKMDAPSESSDRSASIVAEAVAGQFGGLSVEESNTIAPSLPSQITSNHNAQNLVWKPKSYGTVSGSSSATEVGKTLAVSQKSSSGDATPQKVQSKFFGGNLLENFTVDKSTYCHAQIRATFYPKFENEKTDQEIRTRMIEMVSKGLATLEVSLKHSGSLFMYAGHTGGAYAKNSFGNIYTAVGVFVLSRMFREAWGTKALKEAEFNDFLEKNRMCISMELVTAVLGDHGQRPLDDYVVVTS